jgi:hypothetical protein
MKIAYINTMLQLNKASLNAAQHYDNIKQIALQNPIDLTYKVKMSIDENLIILYGKTLEIYTFNSLASTYIFSQSLTYKNNLIY